MGLSKIFSATVMNPSCRAIFVATRHPRLSMHHPRWYSKGKWPRYFHGMTTNGAIAVGSAIWQSLWPKKTCEVARRHGSGKPSMAKRWQLGADFREVIQIDGCSYYPRSVGKLGNNSAPWINDH